MSLHPFRRQIRNLDTVRRTGRVRRIAATHIEADGPNAALGTLCDVETRSAAGSRTYCAQIVGVNRESVILSPLEDGFTTFSGAVVCASAQADKVPVGEGLLGRAVDALGRACDSKGVVRADEFASLRREAPAPLERTSPRLVLETGIRAVDGLVTLGKGQRVGVFAASGVGKTTLVTKLAQHVDSDITILCLVGERGREVEAIWHSGLDAEARAKSTLVAATSDQSAAMRVRASHYALALAEYWRDRGKHVLLLLDSVTRLAMAMREIGLAAGEPPSVRAYPPSVFSQIPKLMERCGALRSGGTISAIITVLSETDEIDDPISELMKSLLDGHIILSRALADEGHYPPIDACRSVSRQTDQLIAPQHHRQATQILEWISLHQSSQALVNTGLYAKGANGRIDRALERYPQILRFLKQSREERAPLDDTLAALASLAEEDGQDAA
jgi:flagellum-specific ATP synthase